MLKNLCYSVIFLSIPIIIFYLLYLNGRVWLNVQGGRSNLAKIKKIENGFSIKLNLFLGKYKRILKFKQDGGYTFGLKIEKEKGELYFELLNEKKDCVWRLDSNTLKVENLEIEKNRPYYLILKSDNFKGKALLEWKKIWNK